jgi:peptidoglycan/LPS O-acetylase OafA/YrhL
VLFLVFWYATSRMRSGCQDRGVGWGRASCVVVHLVTLVTLAACVTLSTAACVWCFWPQFENALQAFYLPFTIHTFLIGMVLGASWPAVAKACTRHTTLLRFLGPLLLAYNVLPCDYWRVAAWEGWPVPKFVDAPAWPSREWYFAWVDPLKLSSLAGLLICAAHSTSSLSVLDSPFVQFLGNKSYGFYVWFQFVNGAVGEAAKWLTLPLPGCVASSLISLPAAFGVTCAVSFASFVLIERPVGAWIKRVGTVGAARGELL